MESGRWGGVEEAPVGPQLRTGKDSKGESKSNNLDSLPPVTSLGFPLGAHRGNWWQVSRGACSLWVSISGLCESKKAGEGLER